MRIIPERSLTAAWRGRLVLLAPLALLAVYLWPVISGAETYYLRDFFNYHLGVKEVQALAMQGGFMPLVDPFRASGQALVGNPNNVALYPDNLLFLIAPTLWGANAHMWLHLLLAPVALYAMARVWGLTREASAAAGLCYGLSGFVLSQMNLYNLVAGVALAPGLVASSMVAVSGRRVVRGAVTSGILWALLLLAGEPLIALYSLLLASSACALRRGGKLRGWSILAAGLLCGTLLAAPQLVEGLRVLEGSYRVAVGYSAATRLGNSWDPRTVAGWLIPFFFGPPDLRFWGQQLLGGYRPLYFTLYPGMLALGLVLTARRRGCRATLWSWSMVGVGLFAALGGWNPVMFVLFRLPLASSLRYPIKAWVLVAVGAALLCGVGFERCVVGRDRNILVTRLGILAVVALAALVGLQLRFDETVATLARFIAPHFSEGLAASEVARWRFLLLFTLALLLLYAALVKAGRRLPLVAPVALLLVHVGSQLWLLGPVLATDDASAYRAPSPALAHIRQGERVAHSCLLGFACDLGSLASYPDPRLAWRARRAWDELQPHGGVPFGVSYAYNSSPEGLDSVLVYAGSRAFKGLSDEGRIRLLAASGVDVLLTGGPISSPAATRLRLRARLPGRFGELWVYEVLGSAPEMQVVGRVLSGDMREVLLAVTRPDFEPRREVFLAGASRAPRGGENGSVRLLGRSWEAWTLETSSAAPGALVMERAFLPQYRATVDARPQPLRAANLGQMAIEVPAGRHRVRIWFDRRPFELALALSALGLLGLVGLVLSARRARCAASERPARAPSKP